MPNLLSNFFRKKSPEQKREYLFALEIGYESVKSAIWTVANDKTQVLSFGTAVKCQISDTDSLIPACDQSLSDAAGRLDASGKISPDKMIFGLPSDWVKDDKIDQDKLHLLRDLTKKLSLTAIGFVVTTQALVKYLQYSEGVPPTAIIIGFWQNYIEVTLVRLGKIAGVHLVNRSTKVAADVVEGLSRFGHVDMLPSRILIYDSGSNLEDIKQELLSFAWQAPQNRLPFIHFPKVEILPSDFSVKAISLAGGNEVAEAIGLIQKTPPQVDRVETESSPVFSPQDLGFVQDQDIAAVELVAQKEPEPEPEPEPQQTQQLSDNPPEIITPSRKTLPKLPAVKLPALNFRFPRLSKLLVVIVIILGLLGLGGGLFAAYWYLPKATVVITVTPKILQHGFDLIADSTITAPDLTKRLLPATVIETSVTGNKTKSTTGTKLIGDKATGEITVINGTSAVRTFPAGTAISSKGLKFTFNDSVTIASASGTADPNSYQPGKANVKVTAAVIGSDSNLSAGTSFTIGTFSTLDYVAKNDVAFSGGSSKQVAAVAASDLTDLKNQLLTAQTTDAKTKLKDQISSENRLITESVKTSTVSEKYDHAVGDTADSLGLDLTVKASALEFNSADLENLITNQISALLPEGFIQEDKPEYTFTINSVKDKQAFITIQVSLKLTPELNTDQIVKNLSGKSVTAAKNYLESLPGISRIDFKFIPSLPAQILTLPHVLRNIGIVIKS